MLLTERTGLDNEKELRVKKHSKRLRKFKTFNECTTVYRARKKAAAIKILVELTRK